MKLENPKKMKKSKLWGKGKETEFEPDDLLLKRGLSIAKMAVEEDFRGNYRNAIDLYSQCISIFEKLVEQSEDLSLKSITRVKMEEYRKRANSLQSCIPSQTRQTQQDNTGSKILEENKPQATPKEIPSKQTQSKTEKGSDQKLREASIEEIKKQYSTRGDFKGGSQRKGKPQRKEKASSKPRKLEKPIIKEKVGEKNENSRTLGKARDGIDGEKVEENEEEDENVEVEEEALELTPEEAEKLLYEQNEEVKRDIAQALEKQKEIDKKLDLFSLNEFGEEERKQLEEELEQIQNEEN